MKKRMGVVHVVARCQDCGKEFENYKNGQANAARHAKQYKHRVTGESGIAFDYDGRDGTRKEK